MELTTMRDGALEMASERVPGDGRVVLLNLVRYREQATYADGRALPACTGREAYLMRYAPEFQKISPEGTVTVRYLGAVLAGLVAPEAEAWDDVVLVEYASYGVFRQILESEAYARDAEPHRLAALRDWRLYVTRPIEL